MNIGKALNIDVSDPVILTVSDEEQRMSLYTMARWVALKRGVDTIEKKAKQLKLNLDKDKSWLKPLALQKYVDEETPSTCAEIKCLQIKEQEEDALHARNRSSC